MKKTLVIGKRSFLGNHYIKHAKDANRLVLTTDNKDPSDPWFLDLRNPSIDNFPVNEEEIDYCIIAAAKTNISYCERNPTESYACNVSGPLELAIQLRKKNITPIFFSSDYVFDGIHGEYEEDSPLNPITEYGRQKAELEKLIPEICGKDYLILRLSKLYGTTKGDKSLLDEMLQLLSENKKIRAAYDQCFCPININDVIRILFYLQAYQKRGLYNICGDIPYSRYELAKIVVQKAKSSIDEIEKISLEDLRENFPRPKCTTMSPKKVLQETNISLTPIEEGIATLLT